MGRFDVPRAPARSAATASLRARAAPPLVRRSDADRHPARHVRRRSFAAVGQRGLKRLDALVRSPRSHGVSRRACRALESLHSSVPETRTKPTSVACWRQPRVRPPYSDARARRPACNDERRARLPGREAAARSVVTVPLAWRRPRSAHVPGLVEVELVVVALPRTAELDMGLRDVSPPQRAHLLLGAAQLDVPGG